MVTAVLPDHERTVLALLDLPDDEFETLVTEDVRARLEAPWPAALRDGRVVVRWTMALQTLANDLVLQLAQNRAKMTALYATDKDEYEQEVGEYSHWRGRVIGLKRLVDQRIIEAKALRHQHDAARQRAHLDAFPFAERYRIFAKALKRIATSDLTGDAKAVAREMQSLARLALAAGVPDDQT